MSRKETTPQRPNGRRGRPVVHDEAWSKVSVVLMDRQVRRLDAVISGIRRSTGTRVTRAAIIRALIDGVFDGGLSAIAFTSARELQLELARRLHRSRPVRN